MDADKLLAGMARNLMARCQLPVVSVYEQALREMGLKELLEASALVERSCGGSCGDHCTNSCRFCVLRAALAKLEAAVEGEQ